MRYPGGKTTGTAGKIILLSIFAILLWSNSVLPFKSFAFEGVLPSTELLPKSSAKVFPSCQPAFPGSKILNRSDYLVSGFWLNKNISSDTSANSGRHQIAANLSMQATAEFATQIIDELKNKQGVIQGQKGQAFCAFWDSNGCASAIPIVPGLQGFGVKTTAGSGPGRIGGQIIHVTTLSATGAGSLKEAIETSGPRIIVFDVSGTIDLTEIGQLNILDPYITIAGQTAPSPGITLRGNGLEVGTHDVLVQHMRVRVGNELPGEQLDKRDGIEIVSQSGFNKTDVFNVVVDRCSVAWGTDSAIDISTITAGSPVVHDITISNNILSESLNTPLGKGSLFGNEVKDFSIIGNLFAHNFDRNPRLQEKQTGVIANNVMYNWTQGPTGIGGLGSTKPPMFFSIIGNVYILGANRGGRIYFDSPIRIFPRASVKGTKIYLEDNLSSLTPTPETDDPWLAAWVSLPNTESTFRAEKPPVVVPDLTILNSSLVESSVLNNAGARSAERDSVDIRIINDVAARTGAQITSQTEVGGWPFQAENVTVAAVPSNPWEIQPSGYNRVEEWLHALSALVEN